MIEKTLARRYASALLTLANRHKAVEQIEEEILNVRDLYQTLPRFKLMMAHPSVSRTHKQELLRKLFDRKLHPLLLQFLHLLVDKNRFAFLPEMAAMFDQLADAFKGVVRVNVRTYLPLTPAQQKNLDAKLQTLISRNISVNITEDKTVKGGMLIRYGDTIIDGTVSYKLKSLREQLLGSSV